MKIIAASQNLTMADRYNLTRNPETMRMSEHIGEELNIDKYMIREEERVDTGETVTIVSIIAGGKVYSSNSATFVREFANIVYMAHDSGEELHKIRIASGTSKKGREYITCVFIG